MGGRTIILHHPGLFTRKMNRWVLSFLFRFSKMEDKELRW